jgi:hypothetical protein
MPCPPRAAIALAANRPPGTKLTAANPTAQHDAVLVPARDRVELTLPKTLCRIHASATAPVPPDWLRRARHLCPLRLPVTLRPVNHRPPLVTPTGNTLPPPLYLPLKCVALNFSDFVEVRALRLADTYAQHLPAPGTDLLVRTVPRRFGLTPENPPAAPGRFPPAVLPDTELRLVRSLPVRRLAQVLVLLRRRRLNHVVGRGGCALLVPGRSRPPHIPAGSATVALIRIRHRPEYTRASINILPCARKPLANGKYRFAN